VGRIYTNTGGLGPNFPTLSEGYCRPCPCRACLCGARSSTSAVDDDLIGLILMQGLDQVGEAFVPPLGPLLQGGLLDYLNLMSSLGGVNQLELSGILIAG
jgi:hypothetical protein